jgi:hypothetical protein
MPFSPSIVPSGVDQDVYLELDQFGGPFGRAWRETDKAAFLEVALMGSLFPPSL